MPIFDRSLFRPSPPRATSQRLDAAMGAVRAAARGQARAEVREQLVAKLRATGLMLPPPEVDLMVDLIVGRGVQREAKRVALQARLGYFAGRFLSAGIGHQPRPRWDVTPTRFVPPRLPFHPVEVILDREAGQHLAIGGDDTFVVWFAPAEPDSSQDHLQSDGEAQAGQPVAVFRGDYQIGVLDSGSNARWLPLVQQSRAAAQSVVTFAVRTRNDDGEWQLLVGLPHTYGGRS